MIAVQKKGRWTSPQSQISYCFFDSMISPRSDFLVSTICSSFCLIRTSASFISFVSLARQWQIRGATHYARINNHLQVSAYKASTKFRKRGEVEWRRCEELEIVGGLVVNAGIEGVRFDRRHFPTDDD